MTDTAFTIKKEVEKSDYGRFYIEPLTNGYGQTLGNSLRRVLMTSLQGAAITSVRIEGVHHQFSTIDGLKEDVVEFLLNLKKVRLSLEGSEEAKLTLSKKGPGEIVAGDITTPAGVTIVNPDLVIGTLADSKSSIEATMTVKKGYGYVPVEDAASEEHGLIPLDALYSPVQRVNYKVEATRVGRMTNLDRLVMEVWTDGTISPLTAVKDAARILVSYFQQVVEPNHQDTRTQESSGDENVSDELLNMRIEELDIPTRIVNALSKAEIETVGDLVHTPREELLKIKNLGAKSLSIVLGKLEEKGISVSEE